MSKIDASLYIIAEYITSQKKYEKKWTENIYQPVQ